MKYRRKGSLGRKFKKTLSKRGYVKSGRSIFIQRGGMRL